MGANRVLHWCISKKTCDTLSVTRKCTYSTISYTYLVRAFKTNSNQINVGVALL
jgi:hypothetical protein